MNPHDLLSPLEVKEKLERKEDFVLLDVRSRAEYKEKCIPRSVLIPLDELPKKLAQLAKNKEIVTYCKGSFRGTQAMKILKKQGFRNVKVMEGGITMWPYETQTS